MNPILIQGAMDVEVEGYLKAFAPMTEEIIGGYHFYTGEYKAPQGGTYPVVVSKTKIGMANAAAATAIAISTYKPALILNQGLAGAHHPPLKVGDIVLGGGALCINSIKKPLTDGEIDYKNWEHCNFHESDEKIYCNTLLLKALYYTGNVHRFIMTMTVEFMDYDELMEQLRAEDVRVCLGNLGTGDVWNRESQYINHLCETLQSACEDMESYAVYQVAQGFDVPCLGIRIISNNELTHEPYQPEVATQLSDYILSKMEKIATIAPAFELIKKMKKTKETEETTS